MKIELSKRKFYRTRFTVTVLSEEPLRSLELEEVAHAIREGDCSGQVTQGLSYELNGKQMAAALMRQASDPGFFRLTHKGEDSGENND